MLSIYNPLSVTWCERYRYCPEAEQLRQEQEEIELGRRVREAVAAQLAALAVPAAAKRKASLSDKKTATATVATDRKVSSHEEKRKKESTALTDSGDKGRNL